MKKPPGSQDQEGHTEREGFEPPSPFGRSLSRRVQYHSASAPNSVARAQQVRREAHVLQEVVQVVVESGNLYFRLKIRSQSVTTASRTINRGARMICAAPRTGFLKTLLPLEDPVAIRHDRFADNQSGRPDSNRGPLRPERSALPD